LFKSLLDIKNRNKIGWLPCCFLYLVVTETRLDDDLVVFCFLYLVVTETRLDDDLVVFLFFISSSDWNKIGWRPVTTRYKKEQGRHPILFQSLLDIKNNKDVIQSCFSHY
jgi:hypothetical protein